MLALGGVTFKALVENLNDGFVVIDKKGRMIYANIKFAEMVGYRLNELIGRESFSLLDKENQETLSRELKRRSHGERSIYEITLNSKSGQMVPVLLRAAPIMGSKGDHVGSFGIITDMTAIKKAELDLLAEREYLTAVLENAGDAIIAVDMKGNIVSWNNAATSTYGYEKDEVLGKSIAVLKSKGGKETKELLSRVAREGAIRNLEVKERTKSGALIDVSTTLSQIKDASGMVIGVLEISKDITEKKKLERELQIYAKDLEMDVAKRTSMLAESEEEWRRTFDSIPDLISIHDRDFHILRANKAFEEKFGLRREEIIGKRCYEVFHAKRSPWATCPHLRTISTGKAAGEEVEDKNLGGVFWIATSPIYDDGTIVGSVHVGRDVTQRKRMEEEIRSSREFLKNVLESSADAIITTNIKGEITSWNRGAERIYGYKASEMIGRQVFELYPSHLREERSRWFDELVAGEEFKDIRTKLYRADGSLADVSLSLALMRDGNGRAVGTVGVSNDITEQVKAEAELQKAHEKLKKAYEDLAKMDKVKDEFLANISHELKTPLTSIKCALDIIESSEISKDNEEMVYIAKRNADRLNTLVSDILYYAKLEYLESKLAKATINLGELFQESIKTILPMALGNNIIIDSHVSEGLVVSADKKGLSKVLSNLMSNAIKFNKEGGKVTVSAAETTDGLVRVAVSDTGIGISREHLGKLFSRFYQVDGSIKRKYQGTGLGLAIVKSIIEKHGGKVWVESEVGKGSVFAFEIPKK